MSGRIQRELWDVALDQHGYVTSADARRLGINVVELGKLSARNQLEKVGYGIYRFPQLPLTEWSSYMLATLWPKGRGVLSHETALDLHDLCDVNPNRIDITLRTTGRYKPDRDGGDLYIVHKGHVKPDQITHVEGIPIVTPETAIAQSIRAGVRRGLIAQAIETADARGAITPQQHEVVVAAIEQRL